MKERKFSKVTKVELILGATASLMTGIVVGLLLWDKKRKRITEEQEVTVKPEREARTEPEVLPRGSFVSSGMGRRAYDRVEPHQTYRTPYEIGGKPHSTVTAQYTNTNRYTGTRHK